jgi:hypothetical protein
MAFEVPLSSSTGLSSGEQPGRKHIPMASACPASHRRTLSRRLTTVGSKWLSAGLPGATHDLTAARTHDLVLLAGRHRVTLFADKGYIGAGPGVFIPIRAPKGRDLIPALKGYNRRHGRRRALGERGFATLKTWRILNKIRCTVDKVGAIAQAILVLHLATSTLSG